MDCITSLFLTVVTVIAVMTSQHAGRGVITVIQLASFLCNNNCDNFGLLAFNDDVEKSSKGQSIAVEKQPITAEHRAL